jgi:branched-chain amino acid aminotransferase
VIVWVDGRFVRPDEHALAATDHGVLVGDGVFESVRVDHGVAFSLDRHLARLQRSADALRLPFDLARVEEGVDAVLGMDLPDPARLRITVTSGPGPLGSARGDGPPVVSVIGAALVPARPVADVVVVDWPRNERSPLAGVKSTSYVENVLALAIARERGADEALFANTVGNLCEGTGSNVFVALDGRLVTPPLSAGCLAGVTRELLCELVDVVEADLTVDQLRRADEAFLTATTRRVQPIASVDGHRLPACPGPLTRAAAAAFARRCGAPEPDFREPDL